MCLAFLASNIASVIPIAISVSSHLRFKQNITYNRVNYWEYNKNMLIDILAKVDSIVRQELTQDRQQKIKVSWER